MYRAGIEILLHASPSGTAGPGPALQGTNNKEIRDAQRS